MFKKTKLLIVEDHKAVRQGIISLLNEHHFKAIYEAENGRQAVNVLKENQPDIVILDLQLPEMNGFETMEIIRRTYPEIKVIILSGYYGYVLTSECKSMGAQAYLPKNCDIADLLLAIEHVQNGGGYYYPINTPAQIKEEKELYGLIDQKALTPKEIEVLLGICNGKTRKELAHDLHITYRTINFHLENIYQKTGMSSEVKLLKYAIKNGYVSVN